MGRVEASNRFLQYGLLGIIFTFLFGVSAHLFVTLQPKRSKLINQLEPLPQHPFIQVYMNQQQARSFVDFRGIDRFGDDHEQQVLDFINQARQSLDVAVQELRLPRVAEALVAKHRSGVKVRLIIENTYNRGWSEFTPAEAARLDPHRKSRYDEFQIYADENKDGKLSLAEGIKFDAIHQVKRGGLPWLDDTADGSKGSGLMHHKFMVSDRKNVLITSTNFTPSDAYGDADNLETRGNSNNMVVIQNKAVAALFLEEFNYMWGDGPGGKDNSLFGSNKPPRSVRTVSFGDAEIKVKFSPDSKSKVDWSETSNGLIAATIEKAQKSVDMALFVFAEPRLGNILEERQQKGVEIAALVDASFAYREYATTLDLWGYVSTQDCKTGNKRPWAKPIPGRVGIAALVKGDKLHHKFGLIDDKIVITGSHNWSNSANHLNDETVVVIKNPIVAAHYRREFDRLFEDAKTGPSRKIAATGTKQCATQSTPKRAVRKKSQKSSEAIVISEDQVE